LEKKLHKGGPREIGVLKLLKQEKRKVAIFWVLKLLKRSVEGDRLCKIGRNLKTFETHSSLIP
jgi:hypothetical protein